MNRTKHTWTITDLFWIEIKIYCLILHFIIHVTLSTALNLIHRNSFPKLENFPSYFTQLCNFPGEATFEKHADPGKKNRNSWKSRANSGNLLEPFLRSRKEENLYGHCVMNNARSLRILSKDSTLLRGCWFWSKKLPFQQNFDENFIAVERVTHVGYYHKLF